jgi:hypothetical protein
MIEGAPEARMKLAFHYDVAVRHAEEVGIPLATEPLAEIYGRSRHAGRVAIDTAAILDFMDGQGADPAMLKSLHIKIQTGPSALMNEGSVSGTPVEVNGALRYPTVALGMVGQRVGGLNSSLRHELRHMLQPQGYQPLYQHPKAGLYTRLGAGASALGFGTLHYADFSPNFTGVMAAMSGLITVMPMAQAVLWPFARTEWDAELFAWRHRNFQPITLRD